MRRCVFQLLDALLEHLRTLAPIRIAEWTLDSHV